MKVMKITAYTVFIVALLIASDVSIALANPAGRLMSATMSPIYTTALTLDANVTYTFATSNLVSANGGTPDTVIHVQDAVSGSFLAGNDDFNGLASQVQLTFATSKFVRVVVRAYSYDRRGTATLTITRAGTVQSSSSIAFAGATWNVPTLPTNTAIWTQEEFNGPADTVLLAINNQAGSQAIAFNDDDGIGLQSFIQLGSVCTNCQLVYGRYNTDASLLEGPGTIAWDGDVHNGLDSDLDGLGNSYEDFLLTSKTLKDTDADGLDDAAEAIGVDGSPLLKFYTWGADPNVKDAFVEIDWIPCQGCGDPNALQLSAADANTVVGHYAPEVQMHLDIGRVNPATTKSEWTKWGAWGGGAQSAFTGFCASLTPGRASSFHHFHITSAGASGGTTISGTNCSSAGNHPNLVAHEVGHQFFLQHGGNKGSGLVNNKPNYQSIMNYGWTYNPAKSLSRYSVHVGLNPISLAEQNSGLSSSLLTELSDPAGNWQFTADPVAGSIDWNRDGRFDVSVRGTPNWVLGLATDVSMLYQQGALEQNAKFISLARLASPSRFYMFSYNNVSGKIQYRYTTGFANCIGNDGVGACVNWVGPQPVANSYANGYSAATSVTINGVAKLLLVYMVDWNLYYQIGDQNNVWTAPVLIGGAYYWTKPSLVWLPDKGVARVFYTEYGSAALVTRDYNPVTNSWSAAKAEVTTNNLLIAVTSGATVAWGFEPPNKQSLYAAIVAPPSGSVGLWRYDSVADRWTELTSVWTNGAIASDSPVGLAYVPFDSSTLDAGQFYILFDPTTTADPTSVIQIIKTEGNGPITGTSRRFQFREKPVPFSNEWATAGGNAELLYTLGVDTNLRAAWTYGGGNTPAVTFNPIADGIANVNYFDQNDLTIVKSTLSCSLGASVCPTNL